MNDSKFDISIYPIGEARKKKVPSLEISAPIGLGLPSVGVNGQTP